ncbi:retention module-containing protein [Photobacterium minamisatsumaniensis]|uniref:retention module-containing protein n=1 Tax=Photobacterium minamisatsumaniensis TaxID=2910233 RepID=UPI003D10C1C6
MADSSRLSSSSPQPAYIQVEQSTVYVALPDGTNNAVDSQYPLPNSPTLIFADSSARYVVMKNGEPVLVDWPCPTCVLIAPELGGGENLSDNSIFVNPINTLPVSATGGGLSAEDFESLQALILAGGDPTELLDAPAAGNAGFVSDDSANSGFVVVDYNGDSTLADAGFETEFTPDEAAIVDDIAPVFAASGGENGAMQLTEGDLSPNTYPSVSSTTVLVAAGSLPLDASSFSFDPQTLSVLLAELSSEVTSSGQTVDFRFDAATNTIIGEIAAGQANSGEAVVSIEIDAIEQGRDVSVTVSTTLSRPVDHLPNGDTSGLVTNSNDNLSVQLAIQGADLAGNSLTVPVQVSTSMLDGVDPQFGTDPGTIIDEADSLGVDVDGAIPLDVGSDEISTITIDPNQPDLEAITSNGFETQVLVAGNQLLLVDSRGETVLSLVVETDGSYVANLMLPLDQLTRAELALTIAVTATDFDGDIAPGNALLITIDGNSPPGGEEGAITFTEPDFIPNEYPVNGSDEFDLQPGVDRLDPDSVRIDELEIDTLIAELNDEISSGNQPLVFSYDPATGVLSGALADGNIALQLTISAVQSADGLGLTLTSTLEQLLPLDHLQSGNNSGRVTVNGEQIVITVPIQANDTDGDFLDAPAILTLTINDGEFPAFGLDDGVTVIDPDQGAEPVVSESQIALDVGSDDINSLVIINNADLANVINGFSSNGEPVTYQVSQNQLTIFASASFDSTSQEILTVTIETDGSYQVVMSDAFDQPVDSNQILLPIDVLVTDDDGDSDQSQITVTLLDGADPAGGETAQTSFTEPDLEPNEYPASTTASITLAAGSDRLVVDSVTIDPAQLEAVIDDFQSLLTSAGEAITFSFDENTGVLEGRLPDDTLAVSLALSAVQASDDRGIAGEVTVTQFVPLDHLEASQSSPYITTSGTEITLSLPLMATDTDGDDLVTPAIVTTTIIDGEFPALEQGAGLSVNETDDNSQPVTSTIGIDKGSDDIRNLLFTDSQPEVPFTSDGSVLAWEVEGDPLGSQVSLQDELGNTILAVSITNDGEFTATLTGTIDHFDDDTATLPLNVMITDNDNDQTNGQISIDVTDGDDPEGGGEINVSFTEPDLVPNEYPATSTLSITVPAGSDRLVPETVQIDPSALAAILAELGSELSSGGEPLTFSYDVVTGLLEGRLDDGSPEGLLVLSMAVNAQQVVGSNDAQVILTVTQFAPLDHDLNGNSEGFVFVDGDTISIALPIQLEDVDGDSLVFPITGTAIIDDGDIPLLGEDSSVAVNESADLNTPATGNIEVDVGSDDVAFIHFTDEQPSLAGLFSDGEPVSFEIVDGNTLNAFIEQGNQQVPVLSVVIQPDGSYQVLLSNNLDHLDGDVISLPLDIVVSDDDGDTSTGVITVAVEDGDDPSFGDDSGVVLDEAEDGIASGDGNIEVITGSDDIISLVFEANQPSLAGLTSNGFATTTQVNGNQVTVTLASDPDSVVLNIEIGLDGSYVVTQLLPLDQFDPPDNNNLTLAIRAEDRDGDISEQGTINVTILDGVDPEGGNTAELGFTEGDLTPDDPVLGYPVSDSASVTVVAGVDRLDPATVTLDPAQLDSLINELQAEVTASGIAVVATWFADTNTLTLTAGGETVLTAVLEAVQNTDGEQVDITVTVTQFLPLDHNGTDATGLVRQQDDTIEIDWPIQLQDTDGDSLTTPVLVTSTITDGVDPVIDAIPALTVLESDIDEGGDFHPGSNPGGDGETDGSEVGIDVGSDNIETFLVDVDAFNQANTGILTAGGEQVVLVNTANNRYEGQVNGVAVFVLTFVPNQNDSFELLGALDHQQPDNDDELQLEFIVSAQDFDGDVSNPESLVVTVIDDIPQTSDAAFSPVEEGSTTETLDVLTVPEEGADDAVVTAVIINGERLELTGTPNPDGFFIFPIEQDGLALGDLFISPEGQVFFVSTIVPSPDPEITTAVDFEVTDGDDDISISTLTITITDEAPTLIIDQAEGVEDQARNPDETLNDPALGIPVLMTIDVGDEDRGEQIGEVFIQLPAEPHGEFYLDGALLIPDGNQILIPATAFTDPDGDGVYQLQGVTFVSDIDYSTLDEPNDLLDFTVTAQVVTDDGANHPLQTGTLSIDVLGVADAPSFADTTVTFYGDGLEDSDNISLTESFQAMLEDLDGSEVLTYFITITQGEGQIIGDGITETEPGSGIFEVPVGSIDSIELDPAPNFSGDIRLNLTGQSRERGNFVPEFETAETTVELLVNVLPVADDAQLKVRRVDSLEDEAIALAPLIDLIELDDTDDDFGVETLYVRISELPVGAVLEQDGAVLQPDENGVYEILFDELDQVQLIPVPESNVDFNIKVEGVVKDVVDITLEDGTVETVEDVLVTPAQFIEVALTGVVDEPDFIVDGTDWTPLPDGQSGLEITIDEDTDATLDFTLVSGEFANAPLDESETLTFVISNIPEGAQIFDAAGNEQTLVFVGFDPDTGLPRYEVKLDGEAIGDPEQPVAITIRPAENSTTDIVLDASIVVTENDGDQAVFDAQLIIHIEPVVDAGDYTLQSNGLEDEFINLNWQPNLTDNKEQITGLVIQNVGADYQLQINDGGAITPLVIDGTGSVTLSEVELNLLLDGAQLQLLAPEDSDLNLTDDTAITTLVTVTEEDVDSDATDTKDINGTLNVIIRAVVEPDGVLEVQVDGEAVDSLESQDGSVDLSGGDGADGQIIFTDLDPSSIENIQSIVISFPDEPETGFVVIGGINNGDGSWTIPSGSFDNIQILAPAGFTGEVTVQLAAEVQDQSDDGDVSTVVIVNDEITINFLAGALNDQLAGEIITDDTIIVTGEEDTAVDLGNFLSQIVSIDTAGDNQLEDEFSLVISAADLPPGASISGMDFNFVTGEYVIKVSVQADGSLDLSGITLNLPQDFAGDFILPVKYVNTDTASGDTNEVFDTIPVRISPIVDVPERTGDNERVPDIGVAVVETQGLDADQQPIEDGEPEVIYPGIALEDGIIILNVTAAVADISTTQQEGLETVESVVIDVSGSGGFLLNQDGEQVTSLTITDLTLLDNIQYIPVEDFSGDVSLNIAVTIDDTATFDETLGDDTEVDTASFSENISFEIIAVNDEVEFTGADTPVVGDEDSGAISFVGIGGSVVDIDGSESILSIKIVDVPEGFIIDGAANNGGGEWSVSVPPGSTTFDLSSLGLIPPKDFSGTVELGVVVFSKEESLELPAEFSSNFTVVVNPIADRVDTDITPTAEGTEDGAIDLILNIEAFDDSDSYTGTGTNVVENPPETLQIIISNIPDSSQIALPDGVTGTVTNNNDGSWLVTVDASDLDRLVFIPGNANNNNWDGELTLDIRSVDQADVATDDIAVFQTITLDIEAVNDAPELPDIDDQTVEEDTPLVISGITVTDVDFNETGTTGVMTVSLSVTNGQITVVDDGSLTITGNGTDSLLIEGSLDAINTLLDAGVTYQGDPDFKGDDVVSINVNDNGNVGTGGSLQDDITINITVTPKPEPPLFTLSIPQLANTRAALGALVPLIGLVVTAVDADETLFVEVRNLGDGRLVDAIGNEVGTDNGDGSWRVPVDLLDDLFIADLAAGENSLTLVAISQEIDGSEAESSELVIGVRIDNLVDTGNQIGVGDSDAENLVVGSDENETLLGGLADDILIGGNGEDELFGGEGNDELWGGERNASGDGVRDVFAWQIDDLGDGSSTYTDTVKDFEITIDQLDIADILPDNGEDDLERLLDNINAEIDAEETVNLAVSASDTLQQNIELENIDVAALGLSTGSSSSEIINELFNNGVFIVD